MHVLWLIVTFGRPVILTIVIYIHIERTRCNCYDILFYKKKMIYVHTSYDVQKDRVTDTLSNFIPYMKSIK